MAGGFASHAATTEYRVLRRLGSGGMATVYLGMMRTPAGERRVAIKRLLDERVLEVEDNERFIAEAKLVFQLTHANICQVLDLGVGADGTFILMEYVEGLDLRGLVRKLAQADQQLDVASAVHVAREVAQALDYAHRRTDEDGRALQLVHGDVTPQNVLLSIEGEVKLADFGIASSARAHAPGNSMVGGTPGFMAPEAMEGTNDHRADIYALGATLYAALGGRVAKYTPMDVAALAAKRPEIGDELIRIITRATARRREDRFLSAGELEQTLAFHLARRYPSFTPSVLAAAVRENRMRSVSSEPTAASAPDDERLATIVSLVLPGSSASATTGNATIDGHSIVSELRPGTKPVAREPVRRRSPVVWIAAVLLCGGLVGGVVYGRRLRVAPPIVAVAPVKVAVPAAPVVPVVPAVPAAPVLVDPVAPKSAPSHAHHHVEARHVEAPRATGTGWLTVNAEPWGAILLDGKRIADQTPLYRREVPAGSHTVVVFDPESGKRAAPRHVTVRAGEAQVVGFRW